jgi:hypothetical protein
MGYDPKRPSFSMLPPQRRAARALAAEALDPVLKENLVEAVQRWTRLASNLATTGELLEKWDDPPEKQGGCLAALQFVPHQAMVRLRTNCSPPSTMKDH